jgi:hypothetical protein
MAIMTVGLTTRPTPAQESPPAKDTIFARKILMGAIDMNMDEIETMLAPEGKLELGDAQEHAETISTMLMVFPHMFPPTTNQWKPGVDRDPATDTFASPEVWTNFRDFYQRATECFKSRLECQPRQTGRRLQVFDQTIARPMQLLSRDKYEDRLRTRAAFHVSDTECLFGSLTGISHRTRHVQLPPRAAFQRPLAIVRWACRKVHDVRFGPIADGTAGPFKTKR